MFVEIRSLLLERHETSTANGPFRNHYWGNAGFLIYNGEIWALPSEDGGNLGAPSKDEQDLGTSPMQVKTNTYMCSMA